MNKTSQVTEVQQSSEEQTKHYTRDNVLCDWKHGISFWGLRGIPAKVNESWSHWEDLEKITYVNLNLTFITRVDKHSSFATLLQTVSISNTCSQICSFEHIHQRILKKCDGFHENIMLHTTAVFKMYNTIFLKHQISITEWFSEGSCDTAENAFYNIF